MPKTPLRPGDRRLAQRRGGKKVNKTMLTVGQTPLAFFKREGGQITTNTRLNDRRIGVAERRVGSVDRRLNVGRGRRTQQIGTVFERDPAVLTSRWVTMTRAEAEKLNDPKPKEFLPIEGNTDHVKFKDRTRTLYRREMDVSRRGLNKRRKTDKR